MSPVDTPYVDKTNWVINLSSRSLSDAEKALLKKGKKKEKKRRRRKEDSEMRETVNFTIS